jgi:hypothetical protein
MLITFNLIATILLLCFVVGLIGMFLDATEPRRRNLLIGATVFCSIMLTGLIWRVGVFAQ